jgi:hypothetical protein
MPRLYAPHSRGLAAIFAGLEDHAASQGPAPLSSPGSVLERTNAGGFRYYGLQQYGPDGKRAETYLAGPVGDEKAEAAVREVHARIADARGAVESIRMLVREGYSAMDPRPFAVLASLANAGLFVGGAVLAGTYAFEAIVNRLGVRATSFGTEDIDIARPAKLAVENMPEGGLLDLIRRSGVDFVPVPALDPRVPSTRYKERGRSRFSVDLLAPGGGEEPSILPVPELKAHATGLPGFRYLVAESQPGTVISRIGCAAVRLPLPERTAIHKMFVAQARKGRPQKSEKDLRQAAVLAAVLAETQPGIIPEAFARAPAAARSAIRRSIEVVLPLLTEHPSAMEELRALTRR